MERKNTTAGITLIALVITIIILLILAGVTINITFGDTGLIDKATFAREEIKKSEVLEEMKLKVLQIDTYKQGGATLQDVVSAFKMDNENEYVISLQPITNIDGNIPDASNADQIYVIYKNYQFKIDSNLVVTLLGDSSDLLSQNTIKEELSYLITTGNQYVYTGVIPNQDTTIEIKYQLLSRKPQFLFGSREDEKKNTFSLAYYNDEGEGFRTDYANSQKKLTQDYTGIHTIKKDKNEFYFDNELVYSDTYTNFSTPKIDKALTLFNVNTNGNIVNKEQCAELKFYYCKIWDNGTLIREFIPVVDYQNKVCLYDKVNQKLYYPEYVQGNDGFLADDSQYIELKSICTDGNQSIDTGYKPNQDTTVEIKCMLNNSQDQFIYGSRTDTKEKTFSCGFVNSTSSIRFDYNNAQTSYNGYTHGKIYTIKESKNSFYINDTLKGSTNYSDFNGDYNLYLFAVNTKETISFKAKIIFYYCKIWDGNTLVRDFIPVLDSQNKVCLYDKMNQKYYYSQEADLLLGK